MPPPARPRRTPTPRSLTAGPITRRPGNAPNAWISDSVRARAIGSPAPSEGMSANCTTTSPGSRAALRRGAGSRLPVREPRDVAAPGQVDDQRTRRPRCRRSSAPSTRAGGWPAPGRRRRSTESKSLVAPQGVPGDGALLEPVTAPGQRLGHHVGQEVPRPGGGPQLLAVQHPSQRRDHGHLIGLLGRMTAARASPVVAALIGETDPSMSAMIVACLPKGKHRATGSQVRYPGGPRRPPSGLRTTGSAHLSG